VKIVQNNKPVKRKSFTNRFAWLEL